MRNPKIKNSFQRRFLSFAILALPILLAKCCFAESLDLAKTQLLRGDYDLSVKNCLSLESKQNDEVEYFLGVNYIKLQDCQKARECFNGIFERTGSPYFRSLALLGLAEASSQDGDFALAIKSYENFIKTFPQSEFMALVYFGLAKNELKAGLWPEAKNNIAILQLQYPFSFEALLAKNLVVGDFYFTVQVGSFSKELNAVISPKVYWLKDLIVLSRSKNLTGQNFIVSE